MDSHIKSIVAFDLETTSFPTYDGFTTKVTELSFVAISVEHLNQLKSSQTIPRVVHTLRLCFNPRKRIDDAASKASGLDNYLLEHEKSFTENSGNLIKSYLGHLQQPVCLIVHNGDGFDFPILAKELKSVNVVLQQNVLCIDSLRVFREIVTKNKNVDSITHFQQLNETTSHKLTDNSTPKRKLLCGTQESATKKFRETRVLVNTTVKRQLFAPSFISPSNTITE